MNYYCCSFVCGCKDCSAECVGCEFLYSCEFCDNVSCDRHGMTEQEIFEMESEVQGDA